MAEHWLWPPSGTQPSPRERCTRTDGRPSLQRKAMSTARRWDSQAGPCFRQLSRRRAGGMPSGHASGCAVPRDSRGAPRDAAPAPWAWGQEELGAWQRRSCAKAKLVQLHGWLYRNEESSDCCPTRLETVRLLGYRRG